MLQPLRVDRIAEETRLFPPLVLIGAVLALAGAVGIGLAWSRGLLAALTLDDAPRIQYSIITSEAQQSRTSNR